MFALISENKVVQIEENIFPVAGLVWRACDSSVKVGWHYLDETFQDDIRTISEKENDLRIELIGLRKSFLALTDFRVLRFVDEGIEYPNKIKTKRILARVEINDIEAATTLTELNTFSTTFE